MNNLVKALWAWILSPGGRIAIGGAMGAAGATIAGADSWSTAGTAIGSSLIVLVANKLIGRAK